ncbi:MAG: hypothetical protein H6811_08290 [Phycisphaeraceae bacterium]|nr:hypothetical protein [Phycisphaeraceae bacterium]
MMHERRNLVVFTLLFAALLWGLVAWLVAPDYLKELPPSVGWHKAASLVALCAFGVFAAYVSWVEDKLPEQLMGRTGGRAFEQDGLLFMPMIRVAEVEGRPNHCELSVYYENRFSGDCEAVIHLRPDDAAFFSHHGAREVHFGFRCPGGAFGVVHQPIAIRRKLQGMPVRVQVAAAVRYPKTHGQKLRSRRGQPCGTFDVDWALAYRQSSHELGGEIKLADPATLSLVLPDDVDDDIRRGDFRIEPISEPLSAKIA